MRKLALALTFLGVFAGVRASAAAPAPAILPINILVLANPGSANMNAFDDAFTSGDILGTSTRSADFAAFNALTPAQLRSSYHAIVVTWHAFPQFNLDWNTRVLPYLQLGGNVIFEDPTNIADLSPAVVGSEVDNSGGYSLTPVPGLTDGIVASFNNDHLGLSSWDPAIFTPFIFRGGTPLGLYGQIPNGGRILVTGPDQDFHAMMGDNQYSFLLNELTWATAGVQLYDQLKSMILALVGPGKLSASYSNTMVQLVIRAEAKAGAGLKSQALSLIRSVQPYVTRAQSSGWITGAEATALNAKITQIINSLL